MRTLADIELLKRMAVDSRARVRAMLAVVKYKKMSAEDRAEAARMAREHAKFASWAFEQINLGVNKDESFA